MSVVKRIIFPLLLAVGLLVALVVLLSQIRPAPVVAFTPVNTPDIPTVQVLPSPAGTSPLTTTPNIIFITVDSLRADHISGYGYGRNTTPNLDNFINEGAHFTQANVTAPWTFPSNASTLSGRLPSAINIVWDDNSSSIPASEVMLAEYLHDAGYYTAGFITAYYVKSQFGFGQGFDVYQDYAASNANSTLADQLNSHTIDWLETTWTPTLSGTQPLFLYLYYYDPHSWYVPPPPYDVMYDSTYTGTLTGEVYQDAQGVVSGQIVPTARDIEHLLALYDGEITYWDVYFGEMMAYLDSIGLLDKSIVIVTSDHGQMFGEHDKWLHHNALYEEVLRVPLVVHFPGVVPAGTTITEPVQTMDVTPTLLDWLNITPTTPQHGWSLTTLLEGQNQPLERVLFSEIDGVSDPNHPAYWIAPHFTLRSVRDENWKYIHNVGADPLDELFVIQPQSPYETTNEIQNEPAVAANLFQQLRDFFNLPIPSAFLPSLQK